MKALAFIVIQLFSLIFSQYNLSGSYVSSYGNSVNNFNFFENRFNLNADWRNWTAWMELEHSNPPELGKSIMGLRKLRFEYHSDDFTMKIGDVYEYWGNGLVFNMLDDQSIDMDTGIRGGLLSYSPGVVSAEYLVGTQKTWLSTNQAPDFSDRVSNYETHYDLQAGKLSLMLTNNSFDFFILNVRDNHFIPTKNQYLAIKDLFFGHSFAHQLRNFEIDYHYVSKTKNKGSAFNLNSYLFLGDFSFSFSFKDYRFNKLSPFDRFDFVNNPGGVYFFQQMPTANKSHSSLYLGRVTHQIDYNDEIGFNFAIERTYAQNGTILFNYAQSSRHNEWVVDLRSNPNFLWSMNDQTSTSNTHWSFSPYSEWYFEVSAYNESSLFYQIAMAHTIDVTDIFTNEFSQEGHSYSYAKTESFTIPLSFSYQLTTQNSFNLQLEYQQIKKGIINRNATIDKTKDVFGSSFVDDFQINSFVSIGYSRSPDWSISLDIDNTSTEDIMVIENKKDSNFIEDILNPFFDKSLTWANINYSRNFFNSTLVSFSYGSQRAGVYCSNGVCRNVQAFEKGIKFDITTTF